MVVGGYGAVGRHLCERLRTRRDIRLIVAGRRLEAARRFGAEIGAGSCRLDIADPSTWGAAEGADIVVVCIDAPDGAFAARVTGLGHGYIDLTAGDELFRDIERRHDGNGYALLSVGLAPGLTNLMAAAVAARLDRLESVDIGLLFGLGDSHGRAGLDWTVEQIFRRRRRATARVDFGAGWGVRRVHGLDFADQHVLRRTLEAPVFTGICFDSRAATGVTFALVDRLGGRLAVRSVMRALLPALRFGSRACNVAVTARGSRGGRPVEATLRFHGDNESRTTGHLAALAVSCCFDAPPLPGVWHSHQAFDPLEMMSAAARLGIGRFEGLARAASDADPQTITLPEATP